ncbi:Oidioi.mRNA.OKI2018_I69.chr1.g1592.t1.cds [Oikopleura dioica]|uniref:Oidioi.mRNA.OKI2018_I69.chr1.g1592.t1.cds n=1 Tax=Oikopleura dioica TaxID=34765 RepID=A0ABN7SQ34_OIKDI|nr:Oidioi.mRNA.OKI2018_I69.chr1.g1592.t1.cds [Oikopleura dioica]
MKDALLALGARAMFLAHGLLAVWKCQHRYKTTFMFILLAPVLTLFGEALFTIAIRGGQEYRFISPCIALYLGSVVPAIWFLELKSYEERLDRHLCQDTRAWLKLSNESSNAGCEFRFAPEVRYDFAIENTLKLYQEEYDKYVNSLLSGKENNNTAGQVGLLGEDKMREYISDLVDEDCAFPEMLTEINPVTGQTMWQKQGECITNNSYSDQSLKSTFQWQKKVLERACRLQYACEYNTTAECFSENEVVKRKMKLERQNKGKTNTGDDFEVNDETAKMAEEQANLISDNLDKWINRNIPIFNSDDAWINILHQLILFIIIIGRWMLPKAKGVTRDQLSQILLIFIGVGADILEFVTETIKEMEVRCEVSVILIMLGLWSWSLVQFILVVTGTTKARTKMTEIYGSQGGSPVMVIEEEVEMTAWESFWSNPEVWSILTTVVLQDGPFLSMRMYIIFGRNVVHPTILFFTIKNGLVLMLETYRLAVIATTKEGEGEEGEEEEDEDILEDDDMPLQKAPKKSKKSDVRKFCSDIEKSFFR